MLEFALGSGILVTAFTATFQYGYIFYQYNALVNAVNNGAHFGALQVYDSSSSTPSTTYTTAVKNMVIYGDPTGTNTTPVVKSLGTSNVTITIGYLGNAGTTFTPTSVTVAITGYTINGVTGTYTLTGKPAATYPFQGMYCPDSGIC
jgi:archaellum component FlaG (FlaF/FlaG flagellin family)